MHQFYDDMNIQAYFDIQSWSATARKHVDY